MEQQTFESSIQIHSHVGSDGTLRLEGLDDIADLDVIITLSPAFHRNEIGALDVEHDAASSVGKSVASKILEIGKRCSRLPVLDSRTPDEILSYDEIGLPR